MPAAARNSDTAATCVHHMRHPWALGRAERRKLTLGCAAANAATLLLRPETPAAAAAAGGGAGECNILTCCRSVCRLSMGDLGRALLACKGARPFLQQQRDRQQQLLLLQMKCFSAGYSTAAYTGSSSRLWFLSAPHRFAAAAQAAPSIRSSASGVSVSVSRALCTQRQAHALLQRQQQRQQLVQQQQAQQVRGISTKRRRYFKMRKFHKKKYKKKLMRAKKVPFVEVNRPKRTWKTLRQMQLIRKQFRRGIPGKGARMLRLKRQR